MDSRGQRRRGRRPGSDPAAGIRVARARCGGATASPRPARAPRRSGPGRRRARAARPPDRHPRAAATTASGQASAREDRRACRCRGARGILARLRARSASVDASHPLGHHRRSLMQCPRCDAAVAPDAATLPAVRRGAAPSRGSRSCAATSPRSLLLLRPRTYSLGRARGQRPHAAGPVDLEGPRAPDRGRGRLLHRGPGQPPRRLRRRRPRAARRAPPRLPRPARQRHPALRAPERRGIGGQGLALPVARAAEAAAVAGAGPQLHPRR